MIKLITALVEPHRLDEVRDALIRAGVLGMTVTEVRGLDATPDHTERYRGAEYSLDLVPRVRLDVVVDLFDAEAVVEVIIGAVRAGRAGDGKIWITDVERAVRIRTGERGTDALA